MQKIILTYGLIIGTILCFNIIYTVHLCYTNPDFDGNDALGWTLMVLVNMIIFLGVRNYRNKQLNGIISFAEAFKTGIYIALISATMYVVFWLFYYYLFVPDFLDKYIPMVIKKTIKSGASLTEIAEKTKEMNEFRESYKNPLFVIIVTYLEVLPVGLIVAFISALILKRKPINEKPSAGI